MLITNILDEIDAEISRLQQARAILAAVENRTDRKRATKAEFGSGRTKRRTMSPEGRERVRQAQIKRWAAQKKAAKKAIKS